MTEIKKSFFPQLNVFNKENYSINSRTDSSSNVSTFNSKQENEQNMITSLDKGNKKIGLLSCIGLICNRMVGCGIFATPSSVYTMSGSIGLALIIWACGAIIALAGMYVYMEFGTAIPRNGGEKNYLEYIFQKPKFLVTSCYASYIFFLGWAAGNSVNCAIMFLTAGNVEITEWNQRGVGVAVIGFCFLVNAINVKAGIYLQNVLGIFKIGIVIFISITGWVALGGGLPNHYKTNNFHNAFEGTKNTTAYGIVNALYNVIWSFIGYSNVNYALGEVKNPVRTLKIAGPTSLIFIAIIYIFCNIAYFAVVPKEKLVSSKLILAADFFDLAFGGRAKQAASVFVGLSALGNVLSVIFAQGRIIQQLGREGVLPFSSFFATSKPFNSPTIGLFQHFIVCLVTIIAPPPGDAYNFILNLVSYPMNIINFCISGGLLYIYIQKKRGIIEWNPPIRAGYFITTFFMLANLYLIIAPYVPPTAGDSIYESMPYWIHCVVAWGVFAFGGLYWVIWYVVLPKIGGYDLIDTEVLGDDGFWRKKIVKKYKNEETTEVNINETSVEYVDQNENVNSNYDNTIKKDTDKIINTTEIIN